MIIAQVAQVAFPESLSGAEGDFRTLPASYLKTEEVKLLTHLENLVLGTQ